MTRNLLQSFSKQSHPEACYPFNPGAILTSSIISCLAQEMFASDAAPDEVKVSRTLTKHLPNLRMRVRDGAHAMGRKPS